MISFHLRTFTIEINFLNKSVKHIISFWEKRAHILLLFILSCVSIVSFLLYYHNGLGIAYNDSRSHLDIGRRVVEGLKPGLAQLGSVWLPLPHILMVPTIWNDFMWHSGLSGALQSMIAFVSIGVVIYNILKNLGVSFLGRVVGVAVFVANLNILYLQSTAMTELLLLATMTIGVYEFILWQKNKDIASLIRSAFWIMLASLVRYEGWFLLILVGVLAFLQTVKTKGFKAGEGVGIFFLTLAGLGVGLWFLWNQLIFKDALYFVFGPYSAHAQQAQLEQAGVLVTKGNILLSFKIYFYALAYNSGTFTLILGFLGAVFLWFDKKLSSAIRIASIALLAPLFFNILALYFGHSVLFIQGISGNTWFNVRYGIMLMPAIAVFVGYLVHRLPSLRFVIIGLLLFVTFFSFANADAVTIDDARVGSSQKNVSEVSGWLSQNAKDKEGFILISAASHDAIIFSSGLPMKKFIHEGTGAYWESATTNPDRWARWIVMRTNDTNDFTFKLVSQTTSYKKGDYVLVDHYPFADIYEIKPEYVGQLTTEPILGKQK